MRYALPILLFLVSHATAADYPARVVGISDGDTLTVLRDGNVQVKVRLRGIDAPETGQDFGARSKQAASELCFGKTVTVKERDWDRYGRTVAEVILPAGRLLNREQVRAGLAWHYRRYAPKDLELATAETEARAATRGLWSDPRAVPPWDWRRGEGMPPAAPGVVVGNRNRHVFHTPTCPSVRRMKDSNRVEFRAADEAMKAGYRKAGDCR